MPLHVPTMPHDHDDDDDDSSEPRTEQFTRNRRLVGDRAERLEKRALAPKTSPIDRGSRKKTHIRQFTVNPPSAGGLDNTGTAVMSLFTSIQEPVTLRA